MSNTEQIIIALITTLLPLILILPFFIIWIKTIFILRKAIIMKKRYVNGSISGCIFLCIWLCFEIAFADWKNVLIVYYSDYIWFKLLNCFQVIFYPVCSQGAVYSLLYRFWMIYFEFIYAESLKNEQWKIHINPKGSSTREQWIIQHQKDYGNSKWVIKRLFIAFISAAFISFFFQWLTIFGLMDGDLAQAIDSALYIIPLICIFTLWYKMPGFLDSFLVRNELKWIVITYIIALVINITILTTFSIISLGASYHQNIFWNLCVLYVSVSLIFIQTKYISIRIKNDAQYYKNVLRTNNLSNEPSSNEPSYSSMIQMGSAHHESTPSGNVIKVMSNKNKLCDLLQDNITFNLFMYHISTELSTECMFSFIEFTQFRLLLESDDTFMRHVNRFIQQQQKQKQETLHADANNLEVTMDTICKFAPRRGRNKNKQSKNNYDQIVLLGEDTIPLSHIVHVEKYDDNNVALNRYKYIIIKLANKYIAESSDFCINIDWNTRYTILAWISLYCYDAQSKLDDNKEFGIEQYCEMYYLFEKCRKEMYELMKHTRNRFVKTNQFLSLNKL